MNVGYITGMFFLWAAYTEPGETRFLWIIARGVGQALPIVDGGRKKLTKIKEA